jgi:iron complex transport system substrate-binding protein
MNRIVAPLAAIVAFAAAPVAAQEACESGFRLFAHAGGETCIPENAERIFSLHDTQLSLPLLEVNASVIGSYGRVADDGHKFMRGVQEFLGYTFENSEIVYADRADVEAIAALEPDLIVGRSNDLELQDQYNLIAPSVFIATDPADPLAQSRSVADAAGKLAVWERLLDGYQTNIETARRVSPDLAGQSYAKIQAWDGMFQLFAGYGSLTMVLEDLGLVRTEFAQAMSDRGVAWGEETSIELLPEQQADYIFDTYSIEGGDNYSSPRERLVELLPNWCDILTSCNEGRYIVLPREYTSGYSFSQLNGLIPLVTTHIARVPAVN